jgi:hypothetical protein
MGRFSPSSPLKTSVFPARERQPVSPAFNAARAISAIAAFRCWVTPWLIASLMITAGSVRSSEAASPNRNQLKAALLYNFAKYVEWPLQSFPTPASPLVMGIIGANELRDELEILLKGRTINGRPFEIRTVGPNDDLSGCHVLYLELPDRRLVAEVLNRTRDLPALSVGEVPQFGEMGGIIELAEVGNRFRFQVQLRNARQRGLTLSSKLLALASSVEGRNEP